MAPSRKLGMAVAVGIAGALVASTAACSQSQNAISSDPVKTLNAINNVVYFGNPTSDVSTLGNYVVSGTGTSADNKPFFDTVVLFAGNINNQGGPATSAAAQAPVLDLSDSNLGGPTGPPPAMPRDITWITPAVTALHAQGIKVLLGILPNHQGTGWSCPSMSAAAQTSLATQVATAATKYNFDGISIDDEYSDCVQFAPTGSPPDGPGGDASVNYGIVSQLAALPTFKGKIINISTYQDGFAFDKSSQYNLAPLMTSSWTEQYPGTESELADVKAGGMTNSQLGLSASPGHDLNPGQQSPTAATVAQQGYGYMMLWATDGSSSTQDRAGWYTSALQGELGNSQASVVYQAPSAPTK